jgi:hypothetical protein
VDVSSFALQDPYTLTIEQQTISMSWCRVCRRPGIEHDRETGECPDRLPYPREPGDLGYVPTGIWQFTPPPAPLGGTDPLANAIAGLEYMRRRYPDRVTSMADFDQRYGRGGQWERSRMRRPGSTGRLRRVLGRLSRMVRIR